MLATTQSSEHEPRRFRLLVAEDDRAFRELLVANLLADGHEVVAVANAVDLMDALAVSLHATGSGRFDLVLSDVRMPGATGLQVFGGLTGLTQRPPVVFITAFGDEEVHRKARQMGALAVLDKPIDMDELRDYVKGVLAKAQKGA